MSAIRKRIHMSAAALALLGVCAALAQAQPADPPKPLPATPDATVERFGAAGPKSGLTTLVSVNIREMDLPQAIRMLAEEAGVNVTIGRDVAGKVTCNLTNVTARSALDAFLRSNGYDCVQADGVLVIVKAVAPPPGAPNTSIVPQKIVRKTFRLPYTGTEQDSAVSGATGAYAPGAAAGKSGKGLDEVIKAMLSPGGKLSYYERQHVLVVEDDERIIQAIDDFVKVLWTTPDQVFIDSKLLEVSLERGEDLGLRWSVQQKVSNSGQRDQSTGAITANGTVVSTNGPSMGLDKFFSFGIVNANIQTVVEALGTRKRVELCSNPRVLVMNHRQATIVVGQEIPYLSSEQTVGGGESPIRTYAFKEVAVRLEVTPHVSDQKEIFLDVHPTVKSVIGYTDSPRQPILSTREAATNVAVADGSTLIIGGLVQRGISKQRTEVPFIARIPLVGFLFRQKSDADSKNDLIFLLSPRIVTPQRMEQLFEESQHLMAPLPPHPDEPAAPKPER